MLCLSLTERAKLLETTASAAWLTSHRRVLRASLGIGAYRGQYVVMLVYQLLKPRHAPALRRQRFQLFSTIVALGTPASCGGGSLIHQHFHQPSHQLSPSALRARRAQPRRARYSAHVLLIFHQSPRGRTPSPPRRRLQLLDGRAGSPLSSGVAEASS
jgi:hypothetical protein